MARRRIRFIDSHTGGEPTRVIVSGGPALGTGPLPDQLRRFARDHDDFRRMVVLEPRGGDAWVGALLVPPSREAATTGVIFFDNVTCIGMCGHGTIGLLVTLAYLGRLMPGTHLIETPVGEVSAEWHEGGRVTVTNVPAYRQAAGVTVRTAAGDYQGDVAWGGNWFFITPVAGIDFNRQSIDTLTNVAKQIRLSINAAGFPEVDHVMLLASKDSNHADFQNFVLCPGFAYDRSPCGTGTSALLACLASDGRLAAGVTLRIQSIVGSWFTASYRWLDAAKKIIEPAITGQAFITADGELIVDDDDPFTSGL